MTAGIRRAEACDLDAVRTLRLRALAGAPQDFDVSHVEASGWDDDQWRTWFQARSIFVFERDGRFRGMIAADPHDREPRTLFLGAMWLDPEERGRGTAARLIEALVDWAKAKGAERLLLHVVEGNAAARRVYERAGFRLTGSSFQSSRSLLREVEMERRLTSEV